jgi:hypothetical protein
MKYSTVTVLQHIIYLRPVLQTSSTKHKQYKVLLVHYASTTMEIWSLALPHNPESLQAGLLIDSAKAHRNQQFHKTTISPRSIHLVWQTRNTFCPCPLHPCETRSTSSPLILLLRQHSNSRQCSLHMLNAHSTCTVQAQQPGWITPRPSCHRVSWSACLAGTS